MNRVIPSGNEKKVIISKDEFIVPFEKGLCNEQGKEQCD